MSKKSGAQKYRKNLYFWSFFEGAVLSTVLVYFPREIMKKGAIYELDNHFKEKYTLVK